MPKVSIIIPFNNVEAYIEECLNSVLNQSLKDIEVIIINDASTDGTSDIVLRYAQNDKRIKVIDIPERHGQGYARNRGIEIAQGEYIGFVDSDDFVDLKMFEIMYNKALKTESDITMCQVREYDDMNKKYSTSDYYSLSVLSSMGSSVFSAEDTKNVLLDINVALWNKIYKKDYLIKTGEKFPEGFIYEDLPFFFGTYAPAKRISIVWEYLYSYRINRKNSTMQQFNNKILDRSPMVSLTYEKLKKLPYFSEIKNRVQGWIINDLFHRYTLLKENYHREFFFLMKKTFQNLDIENPNDEYWKKVYHFQGYQYVINNTYDEFSKKVFNEYLDLHKMEDRLHSELVNAPEVDEKISKVYSEISKNYDYTNEKIKEITAQTDEKISKVYEDISKNYDYTNEKINEIKADIKENVPKPLYNDIKDLSYILHDKTEEFNAEKIKQENNIHLLNERINKIELSAEDTQKELQECITNKNSEVQVLIKTKEDALLQYIKELKNDAAEERQKYYTETENIKNEFKTVYQQIQKRHEEEIDSLKLEIHKLEEELKEAMKSPVRKFVEKYTSQKRK